MLKTNISYFSIQNGANALFMFSPAFGRQAVPNGMQAVPTAGKLEGTKRSVLMTEGNNVVKYFLNQFRV
mgnify:CR=1 FL=1